MQAMSEPHANPIDTERRQLLQSLGAMALVAGRSSFAADAVGGLYVVEIVLFRQTGVPAGEDLAAASTQDARRDNDQGGGAGNQRLGELLHASKFKLGDVAARLNANGARRVIAHLAWTQTASGWNSNAGVTAEQLGLAASGISGLVSLERGQYLHLGFNLEYTAPNAHYRLSELRRVKLTERNYYDHPAIGIVAVVSPVG
ncbi:MAG: hypothetical protein RLZZ200_1663 [Pseudomonadota bacterium]|jgi:hypothetical protein